MNALAPLTIPRDLPDEARRMLAHFDEGYSRAAVIAAYDPAEMRRQAKSVREAGMDWAGEKIEARARIIELDPRLELAGSALVQADGVTRHLLTLYCDLLQAQAEVRLSRRIAA